MVQKQGSSSHINAVFMAGDRYGNAASIKDEEDAEEDPRSTWAVTKKMPEQQPCDDFKAVPTASPAGQRQQLCLWVSPALPSLLVAGLIVCLCVSLDDLAIVAGRTDY